MVVYQFQCHRCFIVSGRMSTDPNAAPSCCGGEEMRAFPIGEDGATDGETDSMPTLDEMVQKMIINGIWGKW